MNFTSVEFLLFAPLVILIHWWLPPRLRKYWLLGASVFFYMYWNPVLILLVLLSALVDYGCSLAMTRCPPGTWGRRVLLLTSVTVNLGLLFTFKYLNLMTGTLNGLFAWLSLPQRLPAADLILPVGISFYTFQTMSYTIDVYRGRMEPERDFSGFFLYVSFFPQLVAGPIERPENLLPQLQRSRVWNREYLAQGSVYLLTGFFKKLVVADALAPLVDRVYGSPENAAGPAVLLATVLFGFQIYCDFSGYSDIARGTAKLMGIDLMENFRRPYAAASVRDFWRRWHISLTSWFTDYVYIPLGGSRQGLGRRCRNILIVFLLSGLWHGADWTFVLWGGIHGLAQIVELLLEKRGFRLPKVLDHVLTFCLVSLSWLPFRAASLEELGILLGRLGTGWEGLPDWNYLHLGLAFLCLGLVERLKKKQAPDHQWALACFCTLAAICLGWLAVLAANGQNAFIYFQF